MLSLVLQQVKLLQDKGGGVWWIGLWTIISCGLDFGLRVNICGLCGLIVIFALFIVVCALCPPGGLFM